MTMKWNGNEMKKKYGSIEEKEKQRKKEERKCV